MGAIAGLIALAAALAAAPTVTMAPEEGVTLRLDGHGALQVALRDRAEWTPYDLEGARNFVQGAYDRPEGAPNAVSPETPGRLEGPPIVADRVRLRFMLIADRQSALLVENGYDRALVYRARITVGGETRATDVCIVLPNARSSEYWPDAIQRVALTDFRLVDWEEGREAICE
jgi:hypothetical protein